MYRIIVVHVDGSARQASRLRAAALLAVKYGAHLVGSAATGISWMDYSLLTGSMAAPVIGDDFQALREAAAAHLESFKLAAARLGVASIDARLVEDDPRYALLLQSRYADLVVLSQDGPDQAGLPLRVRGLPEHVALRGARPVLVVPDTYQGEPIPGTAVVGWVGGTQALRAIAAALPLLEHAAAVKLAVINPDALSDLHGAQLRRRTDGGRRLRPQPLPRVDAGRHHARTAGAGAVADADRALSAPASPASGRGARSRRTAAH